MVSLGCFILGFAVASVSLSNARELHSSAATAPTVKVTQGTLRGAVERSADGTTYYQFLGIPYAKPPVGNLRFTAPQEPSSWSGVKDATKLGNFCYQANSYEGSEDCLFLNVYTPELPRSGANASLLPVMVAIHGGGFVEGTGNRGPGQLIDHGVVVVFMNYRLNLFGFMSIEGTDAPGNAGLKDQTAALRWVKNNIEHFGGNPNSVTIFGMSAGGASVHYHVLSPLSKGLFHRAISESGSALSTFAFTENNQQYAFQLSSLVGKPAKTSSQLLSNLRSVSASELIKTLPKVTHPGGSARPFVPSIEFARNGEQPFLRRSPTVLLEEGAFNYVPYITGTAKREVAAFLKNETLSSQKYLNNVNKNYEGSLVPYSLGLKRGSPKSKEVAEKVKKFYFGNESISYNTREKWIGALTDIQFTIGTVTTVHAHAKYSKAHTYNYWTTYGPATHGYEWGYVIYNHKVHGETSSSAKLASSLGQLWTSFAKTGVPTAAGEVTWKPVSTSSYPYLDINVPNTLKMDLEKEKMDFWFDIIKTYRNGTGA